MSSQSQSTQELHLRPIPPLASSPQRKSTPTQSSVTLTFDYSPSDDGTDENLLVLLHGLGDSHIPFAKLGRSLHLPQTATLALCAPLPVPFLTPPASQWYPSFDTLGDILTKPNPSGALNALTRIIATLVTDCGWAPSRIHLFGFGQGGTLACELALKVWRDGSLPHEGSKPALGSIVSISGPLLSFPTMPQPERCPTPVLIFHRLPPTSEPLPASTVSSLKRGFSRVDEVTIAGGEGMPRSRDEWVDVMRFWADVLKRREIGFEEVYEVVPGRSLP